MKYFILVFMFLFSLNNLHSQTDFVASGGNLTNSSSLDVDYSIGQIFYQNISSNLSYKEGVLQSFYLDGDVIEFDFISLKAYPNPTTNRIFISLGIDDIGALGYSVSSVAGAYIMEEQLIQIHSHWMFQHYQTVYILSTYLNRKNLIKQSK